MENEIGPSYVTFSVPCVHVEIRMDRRASSYARANRFHERGSSCYYILFGDHIYVEPGLAFGLEPRCKHFSVSCVSSDPHYINQRVIDGFRH